MHRLFIFYYRKRLSLMLIKFEKKYRFTLIALAINIFYLIICLFFGNHSYFGTVDDYFMARTLEGVFGNNYNIHLTFVNVVYGYLLLPLYHIFPKVGWYYVGEMAEVFVSFMVITVVLLKKMESWWGTIISLLFVLFFARDFYLMLQFTQCAAVLGAAGMLLWVCGVETEKNKRLLFLGGGVLILLSAMMRMSALEMGVPFLLCAMLFQIRACLQNKRILVVALLAVFSGLYGIDKFNRLHYTSPEYHKYKEFQAPRATLGDKSNYDKELFCDELEEENFSCDDYRLLNTWTFYDTEVFAIDTLKTVAKKINQRTFSLQPKKLFGEVLMQMERSMDKPGLWAFLLFCGLLFVSKVGKSRYAIISFLIMIALMSYLLYWQRFVYRVESGLWLYATTLTIPFIGRLRMISSKPFYLFVSVIIIAIVLLFAYSGMYVRSVQNGDLQKSPLVFKSAVPKYKALFNYIDSSPNDAIYFANTRMYKRFNYYRNPPYLSEPIGNWKKIAPLGYWTPYFPDIEFHLKEHGVSNPLHDIVLDNMYVIDDDGLVDYLQRHYYDSVNVQVVKEFDDVKIFKYSVVDKCEKYDSIH